MITKGKVISKDEGVAMPNGTRVPMKSIGAGWGGEAPVKKVTKTAVKQTPTMPTGKPLTQPMARPAIKPMKQIVPKTKFKMNKKGVISKIK